MDEMPGYKMNEWIMNEWVSEMWEEDRPDKEAGTQTESVSG